MSDADRRYDAPNAAFQDYATSGAFQVSLARNQVAALAMAVGGLKDQFAGLSVAALVRKGLLVPVLAQPGSFADATDPVRMEYRPTAEGLHVAALCGLAGLTNGAPEPLAAEISALHADLAAARAKLHEALLDRRSLVVRLEAAEHQRDTLALEKSRGFDVPDGPRIRLRDPRPNRTTAEIRADMVEVEE